jgi:hypothetical protein
MHRVNPTGNVNRRFARKKVQKATVIASYKQPERKLWRPDAQPHQTFSLTDANNRVHIFNDKASHDQYKRLTDPQNGFQGAIVHEGITPLALAAAFGLIPGVNAGAMAAAAVPGGIPPAAAAAAAGAAAAAAAVVPPQPPPPPPVGPPAGAPPPYAHYFPHYAPVAAGVPHPGDAVPGGIAGLHRALYPWEALRRINGGGFSWGSDDGINFNATAAGFVPHGAVSPAMFVSTPSSKQFTQGRLKKPLLEASLHSMNHHVLM